MRAGGSAAGQFDAAKGVRADDRNSATGTCASSGEARRRPVTARGRGGPRGLPYSTSATPAPRRTKRRRRSASSGPTDRRVGSQVGERAAPTSTVAARASTTLLAGHNPQLRPVLLRLQDRRLPLPRQILKAVRAEQRLVELSALEIAHLRERWVGDDLPDAAGRSATRFSRYRNEAGAIARAPHRPSERKGALDRFSDSKGAAARAAGQEQWSSGARDARRDGGLLTDC
jgi:hypothetical protein